MKKRYIQSAWLTGLLIIWGSLLTGCSEQSEPDVPQGEQLQIRSLTRNSSEDQTELAKGTSILMYLAYWDNAESTTKSSSGFVTYSGKNNENKDVWNSGVYVDVGNTYYIYGFMPSDMVKESVITPTWSGNTVTGATMELRGVNALSVKDLCVIIGIGDGDDPANVVRGKFSYLAETEEDPVEGTRIKGISLLMDHLCAAANFKIKIDPNYNKLRTIKLKSMKFVCTSQIMYSKANVKITLINGQTNPISIITTEQDNGQDADTSPAEQTFFEDTDGIELKEDESIIDVTGYFLPAYASTLSIVSTYDVYDKKGNKIREDCKATNSLASMLNGIQRGKKRPIELTVNPTYLYVLSEPDLDNPTITIGN